ncbi:MAG: sulfotransferase, partial [Alphaproteobacteria bacterium]
MATDKSKKPKNGLRAAEAARQKGDLAGAERICRAVLKQQPGDPDALFMLGNLLMQTGRAGKAIDSLEKALGEAGRSGRRPNPLWVLMLGGARKESGDLAGALEAFEEALRLDPDNVDARYWRADSLWTLGRVDEAIEDLRAVLQKAPNHPRAGSNLGAALQNKGDVPGALDALEKTLAIHPDSPEALFNYGAALRDADAFERAAQAVDRSLQLQGDNLEGHLLLVSILIALAQLKEAKTVIAEGLKRWKDDPVLLSHRGIIMEVEGDQDGARKVLRRALRIDPACVPAHWAFATCGGDLDDPAHIDQIETLIGGGALPPDQESLLHFTAGLRCLKAARDEEGFAHYDKGNALKREWLASLGKRYDPEDEERNTDEIIHGSGVAAFAGPGGSLSEKPVFIVGMPRSGTSLTEQILASHPQVFGAGELRDINSIAVKLRQTGGTALTRIPRNILKEGAEAYLARLLEIGGESLRVTDKMPTNFLNLGLIARLFPNARVIHTRRDPMDTGLSCYFQNFQGGGNSYVYSLEFIAHFYQLYQKLMDHWRSVLPLKMLEIDYEALVGDQDGESRRLIEFMGLDWDDACLDFHKTERPVSTASKSQVRQPMYKTSVDAWRRFETQLQPLAKALGISATPAGDTGKQQETAMPGKKDFVVGERPSFADLLHPVTPETFFAEYYDRKPLHIQGGEGKFANVMSWEILSRILNMTAVWSSSSLQLALDREVVPPRRYCRPGKNRDGLDILQPDAEKVMALLRDGASLVANDIDTLAPTLTGVAAALEVAVSGKAQANLYCSWKERQAFDSHFDTHDVYAVHVAGEKLWRLYATRADAPIAHPDFKSYGQDWHDKNKGEVAQEIVMRPGDLLYIPRGLYHDALATSDGTIHIAFGLTYVIGMDVLAMLSTLAVADPAFRANMPRPGDGGEAAAAWLKSLGGRLADYSAREEAIQAMGKFQGDFRNPRAGFALPVEAPGRHFAVRGRSLKVEQQNGAWVLSGTAGAAPVPPGLDRQVSWIVDRR